MSVKRLVSLNAVTLADDPATARLGDIYYNTTVNQLKYYDGSAWQTIGGTSTTILDHIHTYDGAIYSVDSVSIPSPGTIDGGNP